MVIGVESPSEGLGLRTAQQLAADVSAAADWLSELDGAIGDGDHGVNMRKGFVQAAAQVATETTFQDALSIIGRTLLNDVGGAMGPLYGSFFLGLASAAPPSEGDLPAAFGSMLRQGCDDVLEIGEARVGDKTLVDVLAPAVDAYSSALDSGASFESALRAMVTAADSGRDATKDLVARVGRSSRLAERSRGHIDAGAASCAVILRSLASVLSAER